VDIAGNEGPCSATASFTNVTVKAIDVGTPAAATGAVGYTIYLSLSGGTYAQAFQVPITSSICTMTTLIYRKNKNPLRKETGGESFC
jgi:hypothetical protein